MIHYSVSWTAPETFYFATETLSLVNTDQKRLKEHNVYLSICLFLYQMPLYLFMDYTVTSIVDSNIFYKITLEDKQMNQQINEHSQT